MSQNLSSVAVVIGPLRVKIVDHKNKMIYKLCKRTKIICCKSNHGGGVGGRGGSLNPFLTEGINHPH